MEVAEPPVLLSDPPSLMIRPPLFIDKAVPPPTTSMVAVASLPDDRSSWVRGAADRDLSSRGHGPDCQFAALNQSVLKAPVHESSARAALPYARSSSANKARKPIHADDACASDRKRQGVDGRTCDWKRPIHTSLLGFWWMTWAQAMVFLFSRTGENRRQCPATEKHRRHTCTRCSACHLLIIGLSPLIKGIGTSRVRYEP